MNADQMKERLQQAFPSSKVSVEDLTGTLDHWQVYMIWKGFEGMTRIQRHQAVMKVFKDELASGEVHALGISTQVEEEEQ